MKAALFLIIGLTLLSDHTGQKATLIGLDPAGVERRIGLPDEKDELADSDEAYWTYRTKMGTLSVHFQNQIVVGCLPEDFPLEQILK